VLHIPRTLLPDRSYGDAVIYTPRSKEQNVRIETHDNEIQLRLPQVALWHVVTL